MNQLNQEQKYTPKISVGIPTYNRPEGLRRTLESITNQTYQNLEIIVSDNASPGDVVEKIVREFMSQDSRINYFRQTENRGALFNFQFVLDKSAGAYFMLVADDDWRSVDYIEVLYRELIAAKSAAFAFCNFNIRDEGGRDLSGYPAPLPLLRLMNNKSLLTRLTRFFLAREGHAIPHAIYGLVRRDALRGFSWADFVSRYGEYGSDVLYVFWLLNKGELALSDRLLFGCTVGNPKNYSLHKAKFKSAAQLSIFVRQVRYVCMFPFVATGVARVILFFLLPWKLAEVVASKIANGFSRLQKKGAN